MRKLFVALLILSVMGGAFAQEKGSWGTLSGEAALNTTLDFFGTKQETGLSNSGDPHISGGPTSNGLKFGITYENTFGDFALTLPLLLADGYFGTYGDDYNDGKHHWWDKTGANLTYTNGDLTVRVPFAFEFNDQLVGGIVPVASGRAGIQAVYDNGTYGFKAALHDIIGSVDPNIPGHSGDDSLGGIGGYYHFMDGKSQLYVSYNGAYETKWWRASSYVLNPSLSFMGIVGGPATAPTTAPTHVYVDGAGNTLTTFNNWVYDAFAKQDMFGKPTAIGMGAGHSKYHWENIKFDGGDDWGGSGLAYRFFVMPELNVGVSFVATPIFDPLSKSGSSNGNFVDEFLTHPVFGVKYDNKTLAVSAMLGLETETNGQVGDDKEYYINIPLAFGASYLLGDLTVKADLSAMFYSQDAHPDTNALFNVGAVVLYDSTIGEAPLVAGVGLKMLDLGGRYWEDWFLLGSDFMIAYNKPRDGDFGYGDPNAGFWANLKGNFNVASNSDDKDLNMTYFSLTLGLGFKDYQLTEKMKFSIEGALGVDAFSMKNIGAAVTGVIAQGTSGVFYTCDGSESSGGHAAPAYKYGTYVDPDADSISRISFSIKPSIVWSVFSNGSITFTYTLGSDDVDADRAKWRDGDTNGIINNHKFDVKFKWTL